MNKLIFAILGPLIALCHAAPPALGDEITMKSGGRIQGIVRPGAGSNLTIETDFGSVAVDRESVRDIVYGPCDLSAFREREALLGDSRDAAAILDLARWAQSNRLSCHARVLFERVVRIDPDHEEARTALGCRLHQGKWLTRLEYLRATGKVEFRGRWMTVPERDAALAGQSAVKREREEERRGREEARRTADERERARSQRAYGQTVYLGHSFGWGQCASRRGSRPSGAGAEFVLGVGSVGSEVLILSAPSNGARKK